MIKKNVTRDFFEIRYDVPNLVVFTITVCNLQYKEFKNTMRKENVMFSRHSIVNAGN